MKIGGHGLRDHLRLLAPLFAFIAAVWALRLVLALAGTDPGVVRYVSVSVAGAACGLIAVWLVHFRRFGSYANVVFATFLLILWEEMLIIGAIAFTAFTSVPNVYSAPEYSPGLSYARHVAGHLTFGVGLGTLFGSAMGCALLWLLRKFLPVTHPNKPSEEPR